MTGRTGRTFLRAAAAIAGAFMLSAAGCGREGLGTFESISLGQPWPGELLKAGYSDANPHLWYKHGPEAGQSLTYYLVTTVDDRIAAKASWFNRGRSELYLEMSGQAMKEFMDIENLDLFPYNPPESADRINAATARVYPTGTPGAAWINLSRMLGAWPFRVARKTPRVTVAGKDMAWDDFLKSLVGQSLDGAVVVVRGDWR